MDNTTRSALNELFRIREILTKMLQLSESHEQHLIRMISPSAQSEVPVRDDCRFTPFKAFVLIGATCVLSASGVSLLRGFREKKSDLCR